MSLRRRLTTYYIALMLVALLVTGGGLYVAERQILLNGVKNDLVQVGNLIQRDFEQRNETFEAYFLGQLQIPLSVLAFTDAPTAVQVVGFYGSKIQVARVSEAQVIPMAELVGTELIFRAMGGETILTYTSYKDSYNNDRRLLVLMRPLEFDGRPAGVVLVGQSLGTVDRALDTLLLVLSIVGGTMILLTGIVASYLARRGLQPVTAIASTAEQIVRAEDLSRRIPDSGQRDELGRLVAIVNDLLARLELLFNLQRRLIADVSHELRTPLAAMRGNLEILRRGVVADPAILAETLSDLEREASRLTRLVNDLLLLAQSETGVEVRREPVELDTLILEVFRELRPLADEVQLRIGAEDQVTVAGDRDRLKQALLNLTHNALRYTPDGGEVCLGLERHDGEVHVSVSDTGVGIPPHALPQIFDRFYRVDSSRVRDSGGAGLGLAIVKWVAEAHGGRVEVQSEVGRGSCFRLILPAGRDEVVGGKL